MQRNNLSEVEGSSMSRSQQESEETKSNEKTNTVPFLKLFAFADSIDVGLMILGTVGAIGNGLSMPLGALIFGELSDTFGRNEHNKHLVDLVVKVSTVLFFNFI